MPFNVNSCNVTVTKLASSGNFLFVFSDADGPAGQSKGDIKFAFSVPSADMATFAALTSGNSASKFYAENLNQGDYPQGYFEGV